MKKDIEKQVKAGLESLGVAEARFTVEHPNNLDFGDYTTNAGIVSKKAPELLEYLLLHKPEGVDRIELKAGFINFYLSKEFFKHSIGVIVEKGEDFGKGNSLCGKKILLEHSSPNLFKPFHIGHLVNNVVGESIGRLLKNAGAEVLTMTFPSDVSLGIAKAVWGVMDKGWELELTLNKLGEAYAWGTKRFEEDEEIKKRIIEINLNIYNQIQDTKEWQVYLHGRSLSFEYFINITKRLGSEFKETVFESESEVVGKEIVNKNTPGVFEKSEGAIIFKGSNFGSHDDVFINSAGFGTYLTKDIGLMSIKFNKIKSNFDFDETITITDIEQKSHFELVKIAVSQFHKDWADKSIFLQHGRLRLSEGRISSRMGNVPLVEELIDAVKEEVKPKIKDTDNIETIAEDIAIAALKFPILRTGRGQNMIFDLNNATSTEGDSGVYLQYAYARTNSLLEKAGQSGDANGESKNTFELEKLLYRFPEIVERACAEYSPNILTTYLTEIAGSFNSLYANNQIISDTPESAYLLALTKAFNTVMKNGLNILGIKAPEKM